MLVIAKKRRASPANTFTPHPVPKIATLTASSGAGCTVDQTVINGHRQAKTTGLFSKELGDSLYL